MAQTKCLICEHNHCNAGFLDHHDGGCRKCDCHASAEILMNLAANRQLEELRAYEKPRRPLVKQDSWWW